MLYLHCGWLRTGTTSLQAAIIAHRDALNEAGYAYPDHWRAAPVTDHHGLIELMEKEGEEARRERSVFQTQLNSLTDKTTILSSESLTHWLAKDKLDALLGLVGTIQATMPLSILCTLRNVADVAKSTFHRFALIRPGGPLDPAEVTHRLLADPDWPAEIFAGLRRLEVAVRNTTYLDYRRDGSHNAELLREMRFPPELRRSIEGRMHERPRLNARLTQKGATAVLHCDEISARIGHPVDRVELVDRLHRGELRFEDDRPCNLFEEAASEQLHEQALAAAAAAGFPLYVELFRDAEPELSPPVAIDPDLLGDHDLDRLVAALRPAPRPPAGRGGKAKTKLPVIQYWHDNNVPADVTALIATVADLNKDMQHLVFDEPRADALISEQMTDRELAAFRACAVPAMQADYFRYCAVFSLGGVYVDADFRCVRSLSRLIDETDSGLLFRRSNGAIDNGLFLFKAPRHPLLQLVLDVVTRNIERRAAEEIWWMTGPGTLTAFAEIHRLGSFSAAREVAAKRGVKQWVDPIIESIGEYTRLAAAFDGIRITTFDPAIDCVEFPSVPPEYKASDTYWVNWQEQGRTIYR